MTASEVLSAIEPVYARELGSAYPLEIPEGVTPQTWDIAFKTDHEVDAEEAEYVGRALAYTGLDAGCDRFARIVVEDRAPATHIGFKRTHRRPRQYVIRALGWKGATS